MYLHYMCFTCVSRSFYLWKVIRN